MPPTISIEREKLNQGMYQKLKIFIMNKRKRELLEKAQDDHFKKLRRETEERKRQNEQDIETLESVRQEIIVTTNKLTEIKRLRDELFLRLKQLPNEETILKDKQKSETLALLAAMPNTQFGAVPTTSTFTNSSIVTPSTAPRSSSPHQQSNGISSTVQLGPNKPPSNVLPQYFNAPQHPAPHFQSVGPQRDFHESPPKSRPSPFGSSVPSTSLAQQHSSLQPHQPVVGQANSSVHHQNRPVPAPDSNSPNVAAIAAAYLNALTAPFGDAQSPFNNVANSAKYTEVLAALAASGLYSSLANPMPTSANPPHRDSVYPAVSGSQAAAVNAASMAAASNLAKFFSLYSNNNNNSNGNGNNSVSPAQRHPIGLPTIQQPQQTQKTQQQQQQHQLLNTLNIVSPLLSPHHLNVAASSFDTDRASSAASASTYSPSAHTASVGSLLPPATASYRGSITTGQSAQQIQQMQQQQQQQHQQHGYHKMQQQQQQIGASGRHPMDVTVMARGGTPLAHKASSVRPDPSSHYMVGQQQQPPQQQAHPLLPSTSVASTSANSLASVLAPYASGDLSTYVSLAAAAMQQRLAANAAFHGSTTNEPPPAHTRASPAIGSSTIGSSSTTGSLPLRRFYDHPR